MFSIICQFHEGNRPNSSHPFSSFCCQKARKQTATAVSQNMSGGDGLVVVAAGGRGRQGQEAPRLLPAPTRDPLSCKSLEFLVGDEPPHLFLVVWNIQGESAAHFHSTF